MCELFAAPSVEQHGISPLPRGDRTPTFGLCSGPPLRLEAAMRYPLQGVALLTLYSCITLSTPADAQDKRTLTENCSVVVIPEAGRPPLTVMASGTVVDALKVEGQWIQIAFEDPQWGRRVGYIADTCVGVVHPKPAGPAASPTPAPAQRP